MKRPFLPAQMGVVKPEVTVFRIVVSERGNMLILKLKLSNTIRISNIY